MSIYFSLYLYLSMSIYFSLYIIYTIILSIYLYLSIYLSIYLTAMCMCCSNKIEKEKKRLAIEAGMIKTEVTGAEVTPFFPLSFTP